MDLKIGDIVTIPSKSDYEINVFKVKNVLNDLVYVNHPLNPDILLEYRKEELNQFNALNKTYSHKQLDYLISKKDLLSYNDLISVRALIASFLIEKKLTSKQKNELSQYLGYISAISFNNNISFAADLVNKNHQLLDEFNKMWYKNFTKLFNNTNNIVTKKQRQTIFNISGVILAELQTNITSR